jgi:hypothetical protein
LLIKIPYICDEAEMQKYLYLMLIMGLWMLMISGCSSQSKWMEYEGMFATKDFERAQKEIPFSIVLPTYLPYNQPDNNIPDIQGPLKEFQDKEEIKVIIAYGILVNKEIKGSILIYEYNYAVSLADDENNPDFYEYNPELELVTIGNVPVVKTKDDWSIDTHYYSFNSNNIYFVIETHDIPVGESTKVVESMIAQIK